MGDAEGGRFCSDGHGFVGSWVQHRGKHAEMNPLGLRKAGSRASGGLIPLSPQEGRDAESEEKQGGIDPADVES